LQKSALAPNRTRDIASVSFRALIAATMACLMTTAVAGTFATENSILF
jgi:CNT family concentrative nucleoside transporter